MSMAVVRVKGKWDCRLRKAILSVEGKVGKGHWKSRERKRRGKRKVRKKRNKERKQEHIKLGKES